MPQGYDGGDARSLTALAVPARGGPMAVVMTFEWEGFTPEYYDDLREKVGWDDDPPEGNQFHVAWFEDDAVHVVDVWDSEQHFERFFNHRLKPALRGDMKVRGEPRYKFRKLHGKTNPEARNARQKGG
jgi:heme-degrading monooxygenase HmoA